MSTPVDMQPLFWLLVVTPLMWVTVMWLVGMLLVPASHIDPGDDPWADDLALLGVFDQDRACVACGNTLDSTGCCGCNLEPHRDLERQRERWS